MRLYFLDEFCESFFNGCGRSIESESMRKLRFVVFLFKSPRHELDIFLWNDRVFVRVGMHSLGDGLRSGLQQDQHSMRSILQDSVFQALGMGANSNVSLAHTAIAIP